MKENVEEAINRLECVNRTYDYNNYYSRYDLDYIQILLSDYKRVLEINEVLEKENKELRNNYINVQDNANTAFCKVAPPPELQLPTKTLCEVFQRK